MSTQAQTVRVEDVILDESVYPRSKTYWMTVFKYAEKMKLGEKFPPILVGRFKGKLYLVDGWHRFKAVKHHLKQEFIEAEVRDYKTKKEMKIDAVKMNVKHGLPFTTSDLRIIASDLYNMGLSLKEISLLLGISIPDLEAKFIPYAGLKAPIIKMLERQRVDESKIAAVKRDVEAKIDQSKVICRKFEDALKQLIELLKVEKDMLPLDDPKIRDLCAELLALLQEALSHVAG